MQVEKGKFVFKPSKEKVWEDFERLCTLDHTTLVSNESIGEFTSDRSLDLRRVRLLEPVVPAMASANVNVPESRRAR